MKNDTSWGKVADWYLEYLKDEDNYQSQVILPQLKRILDIKHGQTLLDLACGTGFFSELFHAEGAKVIGVDIGAQLIALAKQNASKDIAFHVSPAHKLGMIETASVDKIIVILAIQNIKEVKEMFEEAKRVLKPDGTVVIVLNHPIFRIPGGTSWGWDETVKKQYRRTDHYMSEKTIDIAMHPGGNPKAKTISFHRPLQYYIKLAHNAGFTLSRLEEWISHKESQKGPRQAEEDRIRKEIPLFMMLELTPKRGV